MKFKKKKKKLYLFKGNKGEQLLRQQVDGGYSDGSYHQGGGRQLGGYQGVEGYNDNKHHLADDHSNHLYYNGVRGGRQDLGKRKNVVSQFWPSLSRREYPIHQYLPCLDTKSV